MQKILPWQLVRMRSAVRICPAAPKKFWNRKISGLFLLLWWFFVAQNFRLKLLCWNFQHFFQQSAYLAPAPLSTPISSFAISGFVCSNWNASASIPSGQYLNYSRIESGQFNTSVVVFELPGDFYTFRITSGRPSTNLLFKTIQIRKWFS